MNTMHFRRTFGLMLLMLTLSAMNIFGFQNKSMTLLSPDPLVQESDSVDPFLVESKASIRFFKDMGNYSSVISYIPAKEVIEVYEEVDEYYSAMYQGQKGYVLKSKVTPLNFSLSQSGSEVPAQKNNRWGYLLNKYDSKTAQALFDHKIWKGMTTKMALDSWGYPRRMERYLGSESKYEEWIYTNHTLIFTQDQLVQWKKR